MAKKTDEPQDATPRDEASAAFAVRVLVEHVEGAHKLKANQIVILAADRAAALEAEGRVSADPAGIEWCAGEYPNAPVLDLSGAAVPESDEPPAE